MAADHPIALRRAQPDDIPSLVALCVEHADYEDAPCVGPDPQALHAALFGDAPPLVCWVAERSGSLLGYTSATREFSTWQAAYYLHMDCLYLKPEGRGKGVGEQLVLKLAAEAERLSCKSMQWQTPVVNERAAAFYRRLGAQAKDKLRFYLDPTSTRLLAVG